MSNSFGITAAAVTCLIVVGFVEAGFAADEPYQTSNCKKTTAAENLAFVTNFFTKIINESSVEVLDQVPEGCGYIQHNPWARDGRVGLKEDLVPKLTNPGSLTIARSIASGDYVWLHSKATINGKPHALVDIFRMECGRAAEHWDVIMEMVPSSVNDHAYF